jgi:cysteine desulfurase
VNFQRIYLDHAATTPLRSEVAEAMRAAAQDANYNPSSLHAEGRRARALLEEARERAARVLGASRNEIVFTSGGTEADNLSLEGVLRAATPGAHVVTTAAEHHAVLEPLERLHEEGYQRTVLPVASDGRVDAAELASALRPETVLVSVMYANNEVGCVQPIARLSEIARKRGVLFHTDAVQAPSWLPLDVQCLGVDLLSLSAHKFYGPKGIGLLYVRRGVPLTAVQYGGGQESGRRPGTQNVLGAVGLACALELAAAEREETSARIAKLRDRLEAGILDAIPDAAVNAGTAPRLPSHLNVSFPGTESAALLIRLDLAGIAVSGGSACTSGSLEPSHVLEAMGGGESHRRGAIRFSLGRSTTRGEVDAVIAALPQIVAALRRPAGVLQGDG